MATTPPSTVLLSFDAEEFDLPLEFGVNLPVRERFRIGGEGITRTLLLLQECGVRATFFVTGAMAENRPDLVRWIVRDGHELASHSLVHTGFEPDHPERSRVLLERLSGAPVVGFRMPRLAKIDLGALRDAGYRYDASLNPIWLPGRYNKLNSPRTTHQREGVVVIPAGTSPLIRWPLFWLAFKNQPRLLTRCTTAWSLSWDRVTPLYFHPWELMNIQGHGLPRWLTRRSGTEMVAALREHLRWLKQRARFITFAEHARAWSDAALKRTA
ncbi:MAG: polysaccharide deacetylase family protein [Phycisphaerales bacterium]|nr:polysaccharide deacetylase family protein [Phycisphaerales bacterium]